ncbi:MAG: LytR/AlgR family response regulator transcription factor [Flammeovirgaceae bacterium]
MNCGQALTKPILATGKIKTFETLLAKHKFMRVHNSHLININCLKQYIRAEGGFAIMIDGAHVPISRRRKDEFLAHLQIV